MDGERRARSWRTPLSPQTHRLNPAHSLPRAHAFQATAADKLQYQVLHLTRALKAADAALDAALAPGADLEACRKARWAAPLNQT